MLTCNFLYFLCPCQLIGWDVKGRLIIFVIVTDFFMDFHFYFMLRLAPTIQIIYRCCLSNFRRINHPNKSPLHHMTHHQTPFPPLHQQLPLFINKTPNFLYVDYQACNPLNSKHRHINDLIIMRMEPLLCTKNTFQNSV